MSTHHGGGGGAIVNVSSAASYLGSPGEYVDYAASKAAIDTLTIGLGKEVARTILWLASDEASYITATIVNCSGGR